MAIMRLKTILLILVPLICGYPAMAQYQFGLNKFSENRPGRVYYDCRKRLSSVSHLWKAIAEDGTSIGYGMLTQMYSHNIVTPNLETMTDKNPSIGFSINWPAKLSTKRFRNPDFSSSDPSIEISFMARDESILREKEYPWTQFVVARNNNFYFHESNGIKTMRLPVAAPVFMTEPERQDRTYRFHSPLADLVAFAGEQEAITVYKLAIAKRKKQRGFRDNIPFGQKRIIYSYNINIKKVADEAKAASEIFMEWERSLTDFKSTCVRTVEEDESLIIII